MLGLAANMRRNTLTLLRPTNASYRIDLRHAGDFAAIPFHPELEVLVGIEAVRVDGELRHELPPFAFGRQEGGSGGQDSIGQRYRAGAGVPACLGMQERLLIHSASATASRTA
ncbi:hypothetical protein [Methylobacter sp. sgz302048]|uniref:hypothetical protein n=1 Tax=Methylobacter sp. sgz302048 TaxID=3455945 RepID=UPI003F9F5177